MSTAAVAEKPRTVAKKKHRAKVAKALKNHLAKKGKKKLREQTCVNIYLPAKKLLEAKVDKLGTSVNRVVNELIAKFVGWKGLPLAKVRKTG
jgi:hypothetical protein